MDYPPSLSFFAMAQTTFDLNSNQVDLLKKISIIAWASDILRYGILYRC
jgi:hypothetical protein